MENYLEMISVPIISCIVYWLVEVFKYTFNNSEKFKRFIPLISVTLGGILGIVCFYLVPNIVPASNALVALVIGGASGLTATGVHQISKQLSNKDSKDKLP